MKALSIRQPWAWAILHGKDVENRQWQHAPSYFGPVLLHAAKTRTTRADHDLARRLCEQTGLGPPPDVLPRGGFVGACIIDRAHHADQCRFRVSPPALCSPWALPDSWHLPILHPRPLDLVPAVGQLGFWTPTLTAELTTAMRAAAGQPT